MNDVSEASIIYFVLLFFLKMFSVIAFYLVECLMLVNILLSSFAIADVEPWKQGKPIITPPPVLLNSTTEETEAETSIVIPIFVIPELIKANDGEVTLSPQQSAEELPSTIKVVSYATEQTVPAYPTGTTPTPPRPKVTAQSVTTKGMSLTTEQKVPAYPTGLTPTRLKVSATATVKPLTTATPKTVKVATYPATVTKQAVTATTNATIKESNNKRIEKLYAQWRLTYKSKPSVSQPFRLQEADALIGLAIFSEKVVRIEAHNKKFAAGKELYKMGLNQFSDWTLQKVKSVLGMKPFTNDSSSDHPEALKPATGPRLLGLPKEINWSNINGRNYVTPVKNQGQCSSCWAFGAIASLESHYSISVHGAELVSFSDQQPMDCTFYLKNNGCNNGKISSVYQYAAKLGSLCTQTAYPYRGSADASQCASSVCPNSRQFSLVSPYYRKISGLNTHEIMTVIATIGPVSCEFSVQEAFNNYAGGIYTGEAGCTPNAARDHIMLLTGYGTDPSTGTKYWIVKNSWSTRWGVEGFMYIQRGLNICGIESNCRYPLFRSTSSSNYDDDSGNDSDY